MFGYIRYDMPNLYIKDFMLYKAMYCGLCKGIGAGCGSIARFGLSYDIAFFSALLHNISDCDVKVEKQHCAEHWIGKQPMSVVDELTKQLGCLNTVLLYYKLSDDIVDENKGKMGRSFLKKGFTRSKKQYPEMVEIIDKNMKAQEKLEKSQCDSPDRAADYTAQMLAQLSDYFLPNHKTEYTKRLFYNIGKWIYLIDALDDYDRDIKKKSYNSFYLSYKSLSKKELLEKYCKELTFTFNSIFYDIRDCMSNIKFYFNRDLIDNVLLKGIPSETQRIMSCKKCEKLKTHIK